MNTNDTSPEPEFSYPLAVDKIPAAGFVKTLEPNKEERGRLAARFELLELLNLRADLTAQLARAGRAVHVTGKLVADVIQKCAVTNEPVPDHIESDIEIFYTSEIEETGTQVFVDPSGVEVEPIINGAVDLGELVAQNLGIALNPYPRKPDAVFEDVSEGKVPASVSPLTKLAELTNKPKDKSKR